MKIWLSCSDDETLWPAQSGSGPGHEIDEATWAAWQRIQTDWSEYQQDLRDLDAGGAS